MPHTAFVVLVPEAEACVGPLRKRFDPSALLGVPAHVTVLFPFISPEFISRTVVVQVQSAFRQIPPFSFKLTKVARFPATAYLAPDPPEPFIALTEALVRQFPTFPPFRGEHASIVPHLTVANGSPAEAEIAAAELEVRLGAHGPVHGTCASVTLLENSSGLWKKMHVFALSQAAG